MKTFLSILTLISALWAVNWPVGTKAVIPLTVNKDKIGEAVSSFTYKGTLVLTNETKFKANFSSAANITIFDTATGLQRPAWIFYISSNKDTVLGYFNGPTFTSASKTFFVCAGPTINRVNSASAFTNSGIVVANNFDESAGITSIDNTGGLSLTLSAGAELGEPGIFGNSLTLPTSNSQAITNNNFLSGATSFTWIAAIYPTQLSIEDQFVIASRGSNVAFQFNRSSGNPGIWAVNIGNGKYGNINNASLGLIENQYNFLTVIYDGVKTTNAEKLKIYVNGAQKTFDSFVGTIPSSCPVGTNYNLMYGGYNISFFGKIDFSTFYNTAISVGVISTDYEQTMSPSTFWAQGTGFSVGGGGNIPHNRRGYGRGY